jgi:hypothetical protein
MEQFGLLAGCIWRNTSIALFYDGSDNNAVWLMQHCLRSKIIIRERVSGVKYFSNKIRKLEYPSGDPCPEGRGRIQLQSEKGKRNQQMEEEVWGVTTTLSAMGHVAQDGWKAVKSWMGELSQGSQLSNGWVARLLALR